VMEQTMRVTRGRLRKTRSGTNRWRAVSAPPSPPILALRTSI
jgi:hypothetical protein